MKSKISYIYNYKPIGASPGCSYVVKRMVRTTINLVLYNIVRYDTSKKGGNALRGLRIKRASRLFNPPQASLLLRDEDDRSPNLPSATSEECNDNDCNYLSSNHHNFLNRLKNLPPSRLSGLHVYGGAMCEVDLLWLPHLLNRCVPAGGYHFFLVFDGQ